MIKDIMAANESVTHNDKVKVEISKILILMVRI
jgi:hypothetical protein